MCCSEGGCGFDAIYISIAITVQRIDSLRIPVIPDLTALRIVPATSDQPTVILKPAGQQDPEKVLDEAEMDVIIDILDKEDASSTISAGLQKIRNRQSITIRFEINPNCTGPDDLGNSEYGETSGVLDPNQQILIKICRENIMKKAEEWGAEYNEILAEVVLHEILHPSGTKADTNHYPISGVGPTTGLPSSFHIYQPGRNPADIGPTQRQAYKDIYGKEPPGYTATQGGNQGTPPVDLNTITNDPTNADFYEGLTQTLNATIAYPTFTIKWEGYTP